MEEQKKITTSEQIRQYWDLGMKVKDISKELGIRYQFAYNVVAAYMAEQTLALEKKAEALQSEHPGVAAPVAATVQSGVTPDASARIASMVNLLQEAPKKTPIVVQSPPQNNIELAKPPAPTPPASWATVQPPDPMSRPAFSMKSVEEMEGQQLPPRKEATADVRKSILAAIFRK